MGTKAGLFIPGTEKMRIHSPYEVNREGRGGVHGSSRKIVTSASLNSMSPYSKNGCVLFGIENIQDPLKEFSVRLVLYSFRLSGDVAEKMHLRVTGAKPSTMFN